MKNITTSLRVILFTLVLCCVIYTGIIFLIAQNISPYTAEGWIIKDSKNQPIGSEIIAQSFSKPWYFWCRPSAGDYNAGASGGSNLSPTNNKITDRAKAIIIKYSASNNNPVGADLVTTSGSGLDPHITYHSALYQIERITAARNIENSDMLKNLVNKYSFTIGGKFGQEKIVNVLLLNIELDKQFGKK